MKFNVILLAILLTIHVGGNTAAHAEPSRWQIDLRNELKKVSKQGAGLLQTVTASGQIHYTIPANVGKIFEDQSYPEIMDFLLTLKDTENSSNVSTINTWIDVVRRKLTGTRSIVRSAREEIPIYSYSLPVSHDGLENGTYRIDFGISDMLFAQIVTITNCSWNPDQSSYRFTLIIEKSGTFGGYNKQTINGTVYQGRFYFVIPSAKLDSIDVYYFQGENKLRNGVFSGQVNVPFGGPNSGENKYRFSMKPLTVTK